MLRRTGFLAVLLSIFALLAFQVTPAFAHHGDTHEGGQSAQTDDGARDQDGDADSSSSTSYTEDNDRNDNNTPNNRVDGDNYHPSGKDRSVENGGSGNQGNSESDPDDDGRGQDRTNGGPDKPNGSGGDDLADQDGNNGCGNDDDFEDDNEGWCGKPNETTTVAGASESICVEGGAMAHGKVCDDTVEGASVEGDTVQSGTADVAGELEVREDAVAAASADTDSVLGTIFRRATPTTVAAAGAAAAPAGVLPFTGAALIPAALLGLGMIGAGALAIRRTR